MRSNQWLIDSKSKIKSIYDKTDRFSVFDWVLFVVLAGFCFFSFVHKDLLITGNRSWIMYEGILDFYDNVAEWTQGYGANYMPSTFVLLAIWILPLKLLGIDGPEHLVDFSFGINLWYKVLPLLFFIGSAYMIYRVAKVIGLENHKAKIAMFAFMTIPIGFFSQFIFSQCDIFTVFFVLCGLYCFYRNKEQDMYLFALAFGMSTTFKYFSLVIFVVLLLLREKKVWNIIKYCVVMALPFAIEFVIYYGSVGFQHSVLGFPVLNYVSTSVLSTGFGTVSIPKAGCVIIALYAYFTHAKNKNDEVAWSLYLSCGACLAIFGFMTWHPQWLIFMAPFFVLSAFISKHLEKWLWVDAGLLVVLHFLCSNIFKANVDVTLMQDLIWKDVFNTANPIYYIGDILPTIDTNTTYSMFVALLIVLFMFKHPKYVLDDFGEKDSTDHMHLIRFRLVLTVAIFSIPAFIAAYLNTVI